MADTSEKAGPRTTVLTQDGLRSVKVQIGEYVWLQQGEEGAVHPHLVLLEPATARTLAEYILAKLA